MTTTTEPDRDTDAIFRHSTSTYQQRWYEANAVHTTIGAPQ
jgi:hypothetical protein